MGAPFLLPTYTPPDFDAPALKDAPPATLAAAPEDGVAPDYYHGTSICPEYVKGEDGLWQLLEEPRMDCVVVRGPEGPLAVREFRRLRKGDQVVLGRKESGEEGVYVHTGGFALPDEEKDKFAFRTRTTRESSFSIDYDELYALLDYERDHGFIVWVLGPAVVFDRDSRSAFETLIRRGYVHALLAGNALAVHDLEGALFGTALGRDIYSKKGQELGHYRHLDAINTIRGLGSIKGAVDSGLVRDGIMAAAVRADIPRVLAGSIRDDGPLPGVTGDVYEAQDRMREITCRATTVIALATQLHAIAVGNMTPSYRVLPGGVIRPVYFYSVDMAEFAAEKLANRGSLTARAILTNVQDFIVTVTRGLQNSCG